MARYSSLLLTLIISIIAAKAAEPWPLEGRYLYNRHLVSRPHIPDSSDVKRLEHKAFWRATAETAGMNIGLWAFDRYVQKGHYAYISWNTIKDNFRHGFEWDDDHLSTNMFAHPYNGSIFFNAGRSNGYNFWQSELFAIGGSAMWELFMEREYPSTNDIIATPIGGAAIGEVLYRTSDLIIDDRATGGARFGRELAAFVVNPMRGFTRIITGRAWEHRSTSGRRFGLPPISVDVELGARMITRLHNNEANISGAALEVSVNYGDQFEQESSQPYDYFTFLLELNAMHTQPLLSRVEIIGRLISRQLVDDGKLKASVGLYQHFDYFDSDTIVQRTVSPSGDDVQQLWPCLVPYKLGTPASVGGGIMAQYDITPKIKADAVLHINGIALAGVLTDFYRDYHRNYNWGAGFSIKAGVNVTMFDKRLRLSAANQFYRLYTWQGYDSDFDWSTTPGGKPINVQGDASIASFNHFEFSARLRLLDRVYATAGLDFFKRITHYTSHKLIGEGWVGYNPTIESRQLGAHIMLGIEI